MNIFCTIISVLIFSISITTKYSKMSDEVKSFVHSLLLICDLHFIWLVNYTSFDLWITLHLICELHFIWFVNYTSLSFINIKTFNDKIEVVEPDGI